MGLVFSVFQNDPLGIGNESLQRGRGLSGYNDDVEGACSRQICVKADGVTVGRKCMLCNPYFIVVDIPAGQLSFGTVIDKQKAQYAIAAAEVYEPAFLR